MKFSRMEIELARQLKGDGLNWTPAVGHFVWDENGLIEADSPFHDRVFFILDMKHFLRRSKTIEALQDACVWLPTWEDARDWLIQHGVDDALIAQRLQQEKAIESRTERLVLYRMIAENL
ncbi:hypothetical protein [Crateriforma spongiae]|uniref:hypothetical protein n=1 Tax=Crateriforma spongiae TaxID=2724528 RepID=UPI0014450DDD|nr:hypothetical protein [Crateriforma spongiae]